MACIGYYRVSTKDQNPQLQIDALNDYGCDRIFGDIGASGTKASRPQFDKALDYTREGDKLVVWKLDRLGRNTLNLLTLVDNLSARQIELVSLRDQIDTSTATGRALFTLSATFAQLERDLIAERTTAGLEAARRMGRVGGRRPKLTAKDHQMIYTLYMGGQTIDAIAEQFHVGSRTIDRSLSFTRTSRVETVSQE